MFRGIRGGVPQNFLAVEELQVGLLINLLPPVCSPDLLQLAETQGAAIDADGGPHLFGDLTHGFRPGS